MNLIPKSKGRIMTNQRWRRATTVIAGVTVALGTASAAPAAPRGATPPDVTLTAEAITGECSPRDTTVTTTAEGLSATFSDLASGHGTPDKDAYCHLVVRVKRQPGWAFTLSSVRYAGHAAVAGGETALIDSSYQQIAAHPTPTPRARNVFRPHDSGAWELWQRLPAQNSSCKADTLVGFTSLLMIDRRQGAAESTLRLNRLQLRAKDFVWHKC